MTLTAGRYVRIWYLIASAWILVIFFSSTTLAAEWAERTYAFFTGQVSAPHVEHGLPYLLADKGFHVSLFCILALLLCRAITSPRRAILVLLTGAVVGSCSEYLQSFFPGRDPAIRDVLINVGGTALGLGLNVVLESFLASRRSSQKLTALV